MAEKVFWTMKNGKTIDVDNMDENHLRNTLKMILRNRNRRVQDDGIYETFEDFKRSKINELKCEYDAENYGCRD